LIWTEWCQGCGSDSSSTPGSFCRWDPWLMYQWDICPRYPWELSLMASVPFPRTFHEWVSFKQPHRKLKMAGPVGKVPGRERVKLQTSVPWTYDTRIITNSGEWLCPLWATVWIILHTDVRIKSLL
jgi:hypothetical protein